MEKYIINGGNPLRGEVTVSGAKNAAVAILPAALLVDGICRIENVPHISDVEKILNIMSVMGAKIKYINKNTLEIDSRHIKSANTPNDLARKMRASYYLIGALLGRFKTANVAMPGGCFFGVRPIDQHEKGFKALGAKVSINYGMIEVSAQKLIGTSIYLDVVSVGATINIMLAAVLAEGVTYIENSAKEPHIVDVANFLNAMGANVKGAGTDTIKVTGVERLKGGQYAVIPDQIEAGTYMVAAAATGGEVLVKNVIPKHMESVSAKLTEMGVDILEFDDSILVKRTGDMTRVNVKTLPYPGFPTDMQPQMAILLALAKGTSIITESVWDNRFRYVDELKKMGANIQVDGKVAVFEGVEKLNPAPIRACDLRAGAALVIAGLSAKGTTEIEEIYHIERGYEDIVEKLRALGGDITLVDVKEDETLEISHAN